MAKINYSLRHGNGCILTEILGFWTFSDSALFLHTKEGICCFKDSWKKYRSSFKYIFFAYFASCINWPCDRDHWLINNVLMFIYSCKHNVALKIGLAHLIYSETKWQTFHTHSHILNLGRTQTDKEMVYLLEFNVQRDSFFKSHHGGCTSKCGSTINIRHAKCARGKKKERKILCFGSPFGQRRTRKDWKAWKGKNEKRFLRAFFRRRIWGVSKDKVHADKT